MRGLFGCLFECNVVMVCAKFIFDYIKWNGSFFSEDDDQRAMIFTGESHSIPLGGETNRTTNAFKHLNKYNSTWHPLESNFPWLNSFSHTSLAVSSPISRPLMHRERHTGFVCYALSVCVWFAPVFLFNFRLFLFPPSETVFGLIFVCIHCRTVSV